MVGASSAPIAVPKLLADTGEHAVDEPAGVVGRVPLRQVDGFADGDAERNLRSPAELVDGDAEQIAVDDRHAVDRLPVGALGKDCVGSLSAVLQPAVQLGG